jgi:hypothetical protein
MGKHSRGLGNAFRDKYEVDAISVAETSSAILVRTEHGEDWVPKSQIDDDSEVFEKDQEGKLIVSQWIATQKGWC